MGYYLGVIHLMPIFFLFTMDIIDAVPSRLKQRIIITKPQVSKPEMCHVCHVSEAKNLSLIVLNLSIIQSNY